MSVLLALEQVAAADGVVGDEAAGDGLGLAAAV
jgi:hypothetical protein